MENKLLFILQMWSIMVLMDFELLSSEFISTKLHDQIVSKRHSHPRGTQYRRSCFVYPKCSCFLHDIDQKN